MERPKVPPVKPLRVTKAEPNRCPKCNSDDPRVRGLVPLEAASPTPVEAPCQHDFHNEEVA
jgi:hypothetical protein